MHPRQRQSTLFPPQFYFMRLISTILFCTLCYVSFSQEAGNAAYMAEINAHRQHYKNEFISEPRSPLTARDTGLLDFYPPDPKWRIPARVKIIPKAPSFDMLTYSGDRRLYRIYATLQFDTDGRLYTLTLYQNLTLMANDSSYHDYLFLPFKDHTNGVETYGGGRYLDFRINDIKKGMLILDFNKNYNPYCAYSDGYSCPIPPRENHLDMEVKAGERVFKKEPTPGKH